MAGGNKTDASVALRNAIKVESLVDPVTPVIAILARVPRQHLMLQYQLSNFNDAAEFLALMAVRMGKLLRSGVPDRNIAARKILMDWNTGKIKYFTHPPEQNCSEAYLGAEIVEQFATEFALDELDSQINLNHLPDSEESDSVEVASSMMVETAEEYKEEKEDKMEDSEESESEEEQENDENILPENIEIFVKDSGKKKKGQKNEAEKDDDDTPLYKLEGNQRMKKAQKLEKKKTRRSRQRADKLGAELTDKMESAFSGLQSEAYDFKKDFTD
jgi:nuclear GTP-binding protein